MRSQDIEIGKEYKIGYMGRGRVLATRVEYTNYRGNVRRDGVQVKLLEPSHRKGETVKVASRDIKMLWEEHAAEQRRRDQEQRYRQEVLDSRTKRTEGLADQISASGIETNAVRVLHWGSDLDSEDFLIDIQIRSDQLEALLGMLDPAKAGKPLAKQETKPAGSALDQMFGRA